MLKKTRTKPNWFEKVFGTNYRVFYDDRVVYILFYAHRIYVLKEEVNKH